MWVGMRAARIVFYSMVWALEDVCSFAGFQFRGGYGQEWWSMWVVAMRGAGAMDMFGGRDRCVCRCGLGFM